MGPMPDASGAALAASHAQAQQSQSEWTALKAMAGAGELRFEPAAAERCAQVCQEAAGQIDDQLLDARRLSYVEGFGDTSVGRALAGKFSKKADEAVAVLQAHRQVLWDMRDTYRAAGKAYAQAEAGNQARFGSAG